MKKTLLLIICLLLAACSGGNDVNATPEPLKPNPSLIEAAPPPNESVVAGSDPNAAMDATGTWRVAIEHKEGLETAQIILTQEGDQFTGSFRGYEVSGVMVGNLLTFPAAWPESGSLIPVRVTAIIDTYQLVGTLSGEGSDRGIFGER